MSIPVFADEYEIRPVPPEERTSDWLDKTVGDLHVAATARPPKFIVGKEGIRKKLTSATTLAIVEDRRLDLVLGFVSAGSPQTLRQTMLRIRYIEGVICHPDLAGRRMFSRMLDACGERCALEILHTVNPYMKRAVELRNNAIFPGSSRQLREELAADLREFLDDIGRKRRFSPVTGRVEHEYSHPLYDGPFVGCDDEAFRCLSNPTDALLVVGFETKFDVARWTVNGRRPAGR